MPLCYPIFGSDFARNGSKSTRSTQAKGEFVHFPSLQGQFVNPDEWIGLGKIQIPPSLGKRVRWNSILSPSPSKQVWSFGVIQALIFILFRHFLWLLFKLYRRRNKIDQLIIIMKVYSSLISALFHNVGSIRPIIEGIRLKVIPPPPASDRLWIQLVPCSKNRSSREKEKLRLAEVRKDS